MKEELQNGGYSFGIATDGDADRIGLMSDNGEWISSQETALLLADYIVNQKNIRGNIVKASSVTDKLRLFLENEQRTVIDVPIGFKHLTEKMLNDNIAFSCEESGGFGYGNHMPDKDGLFTGLIIAEMLSKNNVKKISAYIEEKRKQFGAIYYNRVDIHGDKNIITSLLNNPPESLGNQKVVSFREFYDSRGDINGLKFSFEGNTRWLLIRTSETEPLIRVYAEGENQSDAEMILSTGQKLFL